MVKSFDKTTSGRTRADGDATKHRMVEAALLTLQHEGYSGATARRIASRGEFNAPLIFYHFGGVEALLLAALAIASERRLQRYRAALDEAATASQLIDVLATLWTEDADSAEIAAIQELVAAPEFAADRTAEISELLGPWFDYAEQVVARLIGATPLAAIIAPRDAAFAAVALLMGLEKLSRLDPDRSRTTALFDAARRAQPLLNLLRAGAPAATDQPTVQRIEVQ